MATQFLFMLLKHGGSDWAGYLFSYGMGDQVLFPEYLQSSFYFSLQAVVKGKLFLSIFLLSEGMARTG